MTREERAKQFAPFAALTGLEEALAAVEERHMQKLWEEQGMQGIKEIQENSQYEANEIDTSSKQE